MSWSEDTNAAIWKSDSVIAEWVATAANRARTCVATWRLMGELLPFALDETFMFLDLGAGTGGASQAILDLYPNSRAMLADYSTQMMEAGAEEMARFNGRFEFVEFDMLEGNWPDVIPTNLDAVVTSLCVHHLPDDRKQGLFAEILERLKPAGWYMNFDPVMPDDALIGEAWERVVERENPGSAERAHHFTPEERARHENHVRYMIPLDRQIGYLKGAGFEAVDVYWKRLEYVIYGGTQTFGDLTFSPATAWLAMVGLGFDFLSRIGTFVLRCATSSTVGGVMAKYLLQANYTLEGIKGLRSDGGSARVAAITAATEAAGGKVESIYFAFGDTDVYVIVDYPDNITAAGAALAVTAAGGAKARTVVLLTAAEIDAAVKLQSTYRPPGS